MPDGSRSPSGYLKWTKTWITHEYERPGALWGINRKNYSGHSLRSGFATSTMIFYTVGIILKKIFFF